jgi:DNA-binding winged helix-turn-helix (wHTH) protein
MHAHVRHFYEFGEFRLDIENRLLRKLEVVVPLTPKATELLFFLVENSANVLEKNAIMDQVWPGTFVEEGCLSQNISCLRKILGNKTHHHCYIETIPRRGYCFIAPVREIKQDNEGNITVLDISSGLSGGVGAAGAIKGSPSPLRRALHFLVSWLRHWKPAGKMHALFWLVVVFAAVLAFS